MAEKIEISNYKNIQVMKKKKSMDKDRHGIDWWTEHCALQTFKEIEKDEERADCWNNIVKKTDICSMVVQINGSGDSGGIEELDFYDKDGINILPKFDTKSFNLMDLNYDYKAWKKEHKNKNDTFLVYDKQNNKDIEYELTNTGAKKNRKYFSELLSDGWNIYNMSYSNWKPWLKSIELCRNYESNEKGYWFNQPDKLSLEFPQLNQYNYKRKRDSNHLNDFLDSLYYNILPGGWEINEGSYNSLKIKSNTHKGRYYPVIEVNHNFFREEHETYSVNNFEFIEKMNELGKGNKITYNLDTKKGTEEFYALVDELRKIRGL